MISLPQYLLESSFCLLAFYAFYFLFLKRMTFFQLNRAYLLASPLVSFLIPLISINIRKPAVPDHLAMDVIVYPAITNYRMFKKFVANQFDDITPALSFTVGDLLIFIYLIGLVWMLTRLSLGLIKLFQIIRRSKGRKLGQYTVINPEGKVPASSFFSYIFWGGEKLTYDELLVIEHELVHVRQRHSLDVLIMECWVILKWFNPLIYFYRRSLRTIHEYIADQYVTTHNIPADQYASLLVERVRQQKGNSLLNYFSGGYLRSRLKMLGTNESKPKNLLLYLLSFPLFMTLLSLFSFNLIKDFPISMTQPVYEMRSYLQDLGNQSLIGGEMEEETIAFVNWGAKEIEIIPIDPSSPAKLKVSTLSYSDFQQIKQEDLFLSHNGVRQKIRAINLKINNPHFDAQQCTEFAKDNICFQSTLNQVSKNASLQMILTDDQENDFFMVLSISDTESLLYLDHKNDWLPKQRYQNFKLELDADIKIKIKE